MSWSTLEELADHIGATCQGDPSLKISHVCGLENISPGGLCYLTDDRNIDQIKRVPLAVKDLPERVQKIRDQVALIVKPGVIAEGFHLLYADDPLVSHVKAARLLHPESSKSRQIHATVVMGEDVVIGEDVTIDAYCVIGNGVTIGRGTTIRPHVTILEHVVIGEEVLLYPQVVIRDHCRIGDRTVIHPGAVIGADGHGYYQRQGRNFKLPQVGTVEVGADVEIGACTTIDRGRLGPTVIGDGCKLDNQVQIGHNVHLGPQALISGQSAIGGSTRTGSHLILGGQSGIVDHLVVGDHVTAIARTAITANAKDHEILAGMPSRPLSEWRRQQVGISRLTDLLKRVRQLEDALSERKGEEKTDC